MRYAIALIALWALATAVVWIFAVAFGNSTDFAELLGSGFALAVGGVVGLAISDWRNRSSRRTGV